MLLSHQPTPAAAEARRPGFSFRSTERTQGQGGYVMVTFALILVPLLLMVGFAVDTGYWYNRASDMRRAADAAALAGVVWLPDVPAARTAALQAAAKNGFVPSADISITISASTQSDRRLKVTIADRRVGSFFYEALAGKKIKLTRTSFAEYVLAVPMGSPRNFFGTGTLLRTHTGPNIPSEDLYQSVNPVCTDKANGDRYQSSHMGGTCTNTVNPEYRTTGYEMYIEAPKNRTSPIEVRLWDARYNDAQLTTQVPGPDNCTTTQVRNYLPADPAWTTSTSSSNITLTGPVEYQQRANTGAAWSATTVLEWPNSGTAPQNLVRYRTAAITWTPSATGWTGPTSSTSNVTINGPAQYQTRNQSSGSTYNTMVNVPAGSSYSHRQDRIRYRTGVISTRPLTTCVPTTVNVNEPAIDSKRQSGAESYTYTLYAADNTPLNDSDNPQICQQTFTAGTAFDGSLYLGSRRWNTLCTIGTGGPSGRYVLRVTNGGVKVSTGTNDGSNQWGLVAKYTTSGADGLCDGRNDVLCPRVYGKDAISVRAAADANVASFYLAEIAREHAGKKLKLQLFDPGEGGNKIEIMRPSGTNGNTWTPATFSWTSPEVTSGSTSGTNVTSVDVTNDKFNGKLLEITIDLNGYNPPSNNQWWQIRYTFNSGVVVTDRTTWSARIIGDPVHLIEEY